MEALLSFGLWLKQLRFTHDLTQKQLADLLSCSLSTVRKLEIGQRRPSAQLAEQLAEIFHLPLEDTRHLVQCVRTGQLAIQSPLGLHMSDQGDMRTALGQLRQECSQVNPTPIRVAGNADVEQALAAKKTEQSWQSVYDYLREGQIASGSVASLAGDQPTLIRARALHLAGALARSQGDFLQARVLHEQSLALYEQLEDAYGIADEIDHLAWVAQAHGDNESLKLSKELKHKPGIAAGFHNLGYVALREGDFVSAQSLFTDSSDLFDELGDKQGLAECLAGLAGIAVRQGPLKKAVQLLGSATTQLEQMGSRLQPTDQIEFNNSLVILRMKLNDEASSLA